MNSWPKSRLSMWPSTTAVSGSWRKYSRAWTSLKHGLVAQVHEFGKADAHALGPVEQAEAERAGLGKKGHVAGAGQVRGGQRVEPGNGIGQAQGVRPDQRDVVTPGDGRELFFQVIAFPAVSLNPEAMTTAARILRAASSASTSGVFSRGTQSTARSTPSGTSEAGSASSPRISPPEGLTE